MGSEAADLQTPPRPHLADHVRVLIVALASVLQLLVYVVYAPLAVILAPWFRSRTKRFLAAQEPCEPAEVWDGHLELPDGATVFLVAGEASGDKLAARVVARMLEQAPTLKVVGYGGPACRAAGMTIYRDLTEHAVIGVGAVLASLPYWWRLCVETLARFREEPPGLLLTVDFPGLNVCLARWARKGGIRTTHLVAPQLWAHAPWRVVRWRRAVDHLLCLLPFEKAWFSETGIRTTYVGHPLFEEPLDPARTAVARPAEGAATVELLPGSRRREIRANLPMLLRAKTVISERLPETRYVIRLADERHRAWVDATLPPGEDHSEVDVRVGPRESKEGLLGALATSGTVTAELAVDLVPVVTFYRAGWPTRVTAYLFLSTPWICLANLVAGAAVVPERLYTSPGAHRAIAGDFLSLTESPAAWARTRSSLEIVRERLASPNVAARVSALALRELVEA